MRKIKEITAQLIPIGPLADSGRFNPIFEVIMYATVIAVPPIAGILVIQ